MFEAGSSAISPTLASNSWLRPSRPVLSFLQIDCYADRRLHVTVRFHPCSPVRSPARPPNPNCASWRAAASSVNLCLRLFCSSCHFLPLSSNSSLSQILLVQLDDINPVAPLVKRTLELVRFLVAYHYIYY